MKNLTWQNPEQLFVAQVLINQVKSKCCGIKDNQYLLETHSEYMINRFRYEMLNSEKAPKGKAQVLFFERNEDGNVITSMPIGENGKFDCEIPDSYGDFFVDEELKMLEL